MVKYSREKEQLQFKLEAIKEERLQSINERIDTLFDQQKQLKYYVQVNCANFNVSYPFTNYLFRMFAH